MGLILCGAYFKSNVVETCSSFWTACVCVCVCVLAGSRRCLALSPLQAAAAGPDKAQLVDAAGCAYTASQEISTGI